MSARNTEHCTCGASIRIIGTSEMGVEKAIETWRERHVGDGHGPATRQQAYKARIKNDQQYAIQRLKEVRGRQLAERLLGIDVVDTWPVEDVFEYLEADGYQWIDMVWSATDELVNLVLND